MKMATRPRSLCWTCYYVPGVRDLYPPVSRAGRRGVANGYFRGALPTPTSARPGTAEKVDVMCERAVHRLSLFHPQDAR
jgi:hypothetical protein